MALAVYGIAVTSLMAGICEEIVWRGYLKTRFELLFGGEVLAAVSLQAVPFCFWHSVSVHTLYGCFCLIYGGLGYAKTKRLLPVMMSHWL
ncbi:MAG: CPBP family intramembrane glutamic endopeptidase, partial [Candidatus Bathyarchaeia archaeon]